MASKFLGRSAILGMQPNIEKVDDIPGWEGHVYIRELTASDVRRVTALRKEDIDIVSALYMVCAICDGQGNAVFKEDDVNTLAEQLGYRATQHLVDRILRLSDLVDPDKDKKDKDSEDSEGNESD